MNEQEARSGRRLVTWENQLSIRYLTLRELLEKPQHDPIVASAREKITKRGGAADILSKQDSGG